MAGCRIPVRRQAALERERPQSASARPGCSCGLLVVLVVALLILGSLVLFLAEPLILALTAIPGLALVSFGSLWLFGHAYNRNWFDLQNKATESTTAEIQISPR